MQQQRPQINTAHIMANSNPTQGIVLCLPSVHEKVSQGFIFKVFKSWGFIQGIEFRSSSLTNYKKAFIVFAPNRWNGPTASDGQSFLDILINGKNSEKRVYYATGKPWYWNIRISRMSRAALSRSETPMVQNKQMELVAPVPRKIERQETGEVVIDIEGKSAFREYSEGKHSLTPPPMDNHSDSKASSSSSPNYSRRPILKRSETIGLASISAHKTKDAEGLSQFFAAVEKRRTYESACQLAYENKEILPETFEYPEDNAPEAVKRAFTRAVYRALGL